MRLGHDLPRDAGGVAMSAWRLSALLIGLVIVLALLALADSPADASRALVMPTNAYIGALHSQGEGLPIDQLPVRSAAPTTAPSATVAAGGLPIASRSVLPAPTPMPRPFLVGTATYYTPQPGWFGAAGPALRRALGDWRGRTVMVCGFGGGVSRCRPILLSDWCACGLGHVIDLTESAWSYVCGLPLSRGTCKVTVEVLP